MTREEVKELLPVLQAYAEGKKIQYVNSEGRVSDKETMFDDVSYAFRYRIKPEPKYRPFKDVEECWAEMQKHSPFGWIKDEDDAKRLITDIFSFNEMYASESKMNIHKMLEEFTFADGTPFGMKENGTDAE